MVTNAPAFAALAEPMRQTIVERLSERPMAVGELVAGLPVTRPAVSQHLKVLKAASPATGRREARSMATAPPSDQPAATILRGSTSRRDRRWS